MALTGTDKTVAFAVSEDGSGNVAYYAWLGAGTGFGWKKLAGAAPGAEKSPEVIKKGKEEADAAKAEAKK